jgi:hypothetical protein
MAWFRNTILAAIAAVVLSEIGCVPFTWGTVSEVVVLFLFAEDHLLSKTSGIGQNATCARLLVLTTTAAMIVFRALIFLVAAAGGAGILIDGAIKMHGRVVWRVGALLQHKTTPIYLRRIFIYNLQ